MKIETPISTHLLTEEENKIGDAILKKSGYSDFGGSITVDSKGKRCLNCHINTRTSASISSKLKEELMLTFGVDQLSMV